MPKKQEDTALLQGLLFMKHRKLPSFIALSISMQMVLSPVAVAADTTAQKIMSGLQFGADLYNTTRGSQGAPSAYLQTDMNEFQKQQTPAPDKHFTMQNLSKVPGLMEYIAKKNQQAAATGGKPINPATLNCQTLPTSLFEAKNEVCRDRKVSGINGVNPQQQAQEAFAYYNQYTQIDKLYRNYTERSNVGGQSFGVGCMEDAMDVLNGFFAYRLEQMDTMITEMEAATARFEEQSEMDLKSIRESTAILNGENSKFAAEFKNTDIFDYGKRFEDPACNSIMSADDMDKMGKEGGGLLAIEKKMKADFTATPAGSKYTPEQYLKKNADVVAEVRKMAEEVSKQSSLNFSQIANSPDGYSNFLSQVGGDVNTDSGVHNGLNKAFFSDLQSKFTESRKKLTDEMNVIRSELGSKGGEALSMLSDVDNDASFDAELTTLENEIKGECLNRSGVDTALSRIYDPNLSKEANKHTSAQIRKRIKAIIADIKLSPERKMEELRAIEAQSGGRFEMKIDANYETQDIKEDGTVVKKTVNAANKVSPGSYFSDVIRNCETQFQVNKLNNKLSAKETIKKLRTLKKDYQKAAKQHSKDIKDEIVKKMIDCGGKTDIQSSNTVASCSPAKLDVSSPGFCTKAAFSCSKNMQQCTKKAQKFVKDMKDDRLKRTNNYNNNVEANRKQLVSMFDTTLAKYMQEAESLRAMFGAGFSSPKDIQRDIKDDSKFDQKFLSNGTDNLEIKDPKKYLELVKGNMASLRAQVEAQQKQVVDGQLKEHIELTRKNYQAVLSKPGASRLAEDCLAAYNGYKEGLEKQKMDYDKAAGEMGEKNGELCGKYSDIMSDNPNGACEDVREVANASLKASARVGRNNSAEIDQMVREMNARCAQVNIEADDAAQICLMDDRRAFDKEFNKRFTPPSSWDKNKKDYATAACKAITSGESSDICAPASPKTMTVDGDGEQPDGYTCKNFREVGTKEKTWKADCTSNTRDCSKVESAVVAIFKTASKSGALASGTQSNKMPSFCASNNSSQQNNKGGLPMQNPLGGQPNTAFGQQF